MIIVSRCRSKIVKIFRSSFWCLCFFHRFLWMVWLFMFFRIVPYFALLLSGVRKVQSSWLNPLKFKNISQSFPVFPFISSVKLFWLVHKQRRPISCAGSSAVLHPAGSPTTEGPWPHTGVLDTWMLTKTMPITANKPFWILVQEKD